MFLCILEIKTGWAGIAFAFFESLGADAFACFAGHAHGTENIAGTTIGIICLQIDAHRCAAVTAIRQSVLAYALIILTISAFITFVIACTTVPGIIFWINAVGIFFCAAIDESLIAFAFIHTFSVFADFIGIVTRRITVATVISADL